VSQPGHQEPPLEFIWYSLAEALGLLAHLEDAVRTFAETGHLAGSVQLEAEMRLLRRKLGFDDSEDI